MLNFNDTKPVVINTDIVAKELCLAKDQVYNAVLDLKKAGIIELIEVKLQSQLYLTINLKQLKKYIKNSNVDKQIYEVE